MVMLKNPNEPATKKQLWLLHILTKTDTRNLSLTMQQASEAIENAKKKPQQKHVEKSVNKITPIEKSSMPEREVVQGKKPIGITDMEKIEAHFKQYAYPLAIEKLKRENLFTENVRIDFYDFNCKECLFGKSGVCEPAWSEGGYTTCAGKVENVNFDCDNFEPTEHSNASEYCHRPKGKQCHRKSIDNHCLNCNYRSGKYRMDYQNHSAWYRYIPTIKERIADHTKSLVTWKNPPESYNDINFTESIKRTENIIRLLNKLSD